MLKNYLNGAQLAFMLMAPETTEADTGGGDNSVSKLPSEVQAIEAIGKQVDEFNKLLGARAKQEDFENIKKELDTLKNGLEELSGKEVTRQIEAINKSNDSIYKQIVEMQEELAQKKENGSDKAKAKDPVTRAKVEEFVKSIYPDGPLGEKRKMSEATLIVKAPETFGTSVSFAEGADVSAFTGRRLDPTLYQRRRKSNLILDYFNIQTIDVPKLIYLRKIEEGTGTAPDNDPGGAAWILCGAPKPKRSFRVTTGEADAKKVAIFGEIEDCLLQDVPSFERWIREDFNQEMDEAINDGLLNNNPAIDSLAPLGLKTNAIQYSPTPAYDAEITDPTYIDMIFAIGARMRFDKEAAAVVFVSSDVWFRMHHLKSTDARYLNNNLVYTDNMGNLWIGGIMVVPTEEEDVPSTDVLAIGLEVGFKIYAYGPRVFESGLNGENFREDKTSYRGYQRFLSYIPEDRENSVLYDTWANIEAAITAAV